MSERIIDEFRRYTRRGHPEETVTRRSVAASQLLDDENVDDINRLDDPELLTRHLDRLKRIYPESTFKTKFYCLRSFYDFLVDKGYIQTDHADTVELSDWKQKRRDVTRTEEAGTRGGIVYMEIDMFQKIVKYVPEPRGRNELLLKLLFQTGIRPGEVVNIRLSEVDVENRRIPIKTLKDGQDRDVWWKPSLDMHMRRWINSDREAMPTSSSSPYLFITRYSEQMAPSRPNKILKTAVENAGEREVLFEDVDNREHTRYTAKSLRHSFAVHFIRSDSGEGSGDLETLSTLMGHREMSTTSKYLRFRNETLKDKMRKHAPDV